MLVVLQTLAFAELSVRLLKSYPASVSSSYNMYHISELAESTAESYLAGKGRPISIIEMPGSREYWKTLGDCA